MVEDTAHLLEVWVSGWARCRGYETRKEGRFPAALRADTTGEWDYFAHDPSDAEFADLAVKTAEVPLRVLTVFTNDTARYMALAQQHGLNVTSASQTMMIVDMETQDSEDPWLADENLHLVASKTDGVHRAIVQSEDELAASGQLIVVDHTAIFDKIVTEPGYQRRGLGTFIMKALAALAFEHDVDTGLLLASHDGQKLYSHLGWSTVCHVLMLSASAEGSDLSVA